MRKAKRPNIGRSHLNRPPRNSKQPVEGTRCCLGRLLQQDRHESDLEEGRPQLRFGIRVLFFGSRTGCPAAQFSRILRKLSTISAGEASPQDSWLLRCTSCRWRSLAWIECLKPRLSPNSTAAMRASCPYTDGRAGCSALRLRLTRLVVRDEPTHGGDYLLPCRLRSALSAARDLSLRL
jgi:hypothetical protein